MDEPSYQAILRTEFNAEPGSFLAQLRGSLIWDKPAFSRLILNMEECALAHSESKELPRWIAEGFWFCSHFVRDWSCHETFPKLHSSEYYSAAYERLNDLAYWLFVGESPQQKPNDSTLIVE